MNIVIDIGHPAQIHLFRNLIIRLKESRDRVLITSVDKDITLNLLEEYGFDFINLGTIGTNVISKVLSIPRLDSAFLKAVEDFKPDLFIGSASFRAAHISRLLRKPCLQMVDTEMGWKEHGVYAPFSDIIATPKCYRRNLGKKHIRYEGFQELAYLHPHYFRPQKDILKDLSVSEEEGYFIVRFVAWKATHDMGHHGLTLDEKRILISKLSAHGKVFITSETPLEDEFKIYELPCSKKKFLDAVAFAGMVVTESNTVATEAALLGTPVVRVNSYVGKNEMGNFLELENDYGLMYSFSDFKDAGLKIDALVKSKNLKEQWQKKKSRLLKEKIDVTQWMIDFIEQKWR